MAKEHQAELLRAYPPLAGLPVSDREEVDAMVASGAVEDDLFVFLWNELGEAESDEHANTLLEMAAGDVRSVLGAVEVADMTAAATAVENGATFDTLFSCLWREVGQAKDIEDATRRLTSALEKVESVAATFAPPIKIGV